MAGIQGAGSAPAALILASASPFLLAWHGLQGHLQPIFLGADIRTTAIRTLGAFTAPELLTPAKLKKCPAALFAGIVAHLVIDLLLLPQRLFLGCIALVFFASAFVEASAFL